MGAENYSLIVSRVRGGLGPEGNPGEVTVNGEMAWIGPEPVTPVNKADNMMLTWSIEEDAEVAQGGGLVMMMGVVCGRRLDADGTLDDMLNKIRSVWDERKDKKKRGWFGR